MNRRNFVKLCGLSTASVVLSGAAFRVGAHWWDQSPSASYAVLSAEEAEMVAAIADTMFPGEGAGGMPSATHVGIVEFFDDYLTSIDEVAANLLRTLIHGIDDIAVFAGAGLTRFRFRPREEREEILRAWDKSWLAPRRRAFSGLKILIAMGYTESPHVVAAAGWDYGCTNLELDEPTIIDAVAQGFGL